MATQLQTESKTLGGRAYSPFPSGLLQRKCAACGNHTVAGGECEECKRNKPFGLQTKLTINEPGDRYEQEADRIADEVMAMPSRSPVSRSPLNIQRFFGAEASQPAETPESVYRVLASPGKPLEPALRQYMETRFGYDFSNVRIHTDSTAGQSAQKINAKAYTVGKAIVFGSGEYKTETESGRELIAHELTHTIQQTRSPENIQRKPLGEKDKIHGPIEDQFCRETGNCETGSHHSEEYANWITALERLENFKITSKDLKLSRVTRKFEQMSLEELHEYRSNYIISESDPPGEYPHDPAVVKYLTDLMMSRPTQKCTKAEAEKAEKRAQQALTDAEPIVTDALKAVTLLLSAWSGNKQSLTSGKAVHKGEVACAFRSNFNINESDPNWGVTAIKVESKLMWLLKRLTKPVSFECEPINSKVCLESTGRDAEAYVVNHTGPIHLCYGFRNSPFDPVATIIHEMLHFRPGLKDEGGYAKLSTFAMTCKPGVQFTATPDVLSNTADALTGFIMHIHNTDATDLQVARRAD